MLCALVPFNFYSLASIPAHLAAGQPDPDQASAMPARDISDCGGALELAAFPDSNRAADLLLCIFGHKFNRYWICAASRSGRWKSSSCAGCALITSALDVYYRDIRYLVECSGLVMFWLVPVFYSLEMIPPGYQNSSCSIR